MPVSRLELEQFGPFASGRFDLVPGVNVVLGASGTGKTFAAKALYAVIKSLSGEGTPGVPPREAVRAKLAGVFRRTTAISAGSSAESMASQQDASASCSMITRARCG